MKLEMRQKLAREPFAEKIRKVAQLIRLAKTSPRRAAKTTLAHPALSAEALERLPPKGANTLH
jgi:hypothetical protein